MWTVNETAVVSYCIETVNCLLVEAGLQICSNYMEGSVLTVGASMVDPSCGVDCEGVPLGEEQQNFGI